MLEMELNNVDGISIEKVQVLTWKKWSYCY